MVRRTMSRPGRARCLGGVRKRLDNITYAYPEFLLRAAQIGAAADLDGGTSLLPSPGFGPLNLRRSRLAQLRKDHDPSSGKPRTMISPTGRRPFFFFFTGGSQYAPAHTKTSPGNKKAAFRSVFPPRVDAYRLVYQVTQMPCGPTRGATNFSFRSPILLGSEGAAGRRSGRPGLKHHLRLPPPLGGACPHAHRSQPARHSLLGKGKQISWGARDSPFGPSKLFSSLLNSSA